MNKIEAEVYRERERRINLVKRHLKVAIDLLYAVEDGPPPRKKLDVPVSSSYEELLHMMLDAAHDIVEALPDDCFETNPVEDVFGLRAVLGDFLSGKYNPSDQSLEDAQKIVASLIRRRGQADVDRRIRALENVEGRTPEEAASYLQKAEELRRG